jgi:ferredoxin
MDPRYQQLAERIGLGHSQRMAKIWSIIADPAEADILLAMPGQPGEIAGKLGLEEERVAELIQGLFKKGVAFPSKKTDPPTWRMARDLVQFHDASLLWPGAPVEYLDAWREFMQHEWFQVAETWSKSVPKPFTRVIPVGVSLTPKTQILNFENVKEIVDHARSISVTKCTCRLSMRECDRPLEVCLQVNKAADYNIARGSGREVSKEEALDILRKSEEEGLIHVTMNRSEADNFICNCCPCCCQTMPVLIKGGIQVVDPSRFVARVDPEACVSCGACEERCYFGAISYPQGEDGPAAVDKDRCMGCGLCLVTCPEDAIRLDEARDKGFIPGAA